MENLISRYRNVTILVGILFAQILGLAVQVQRSSDDRSTRLIRIWAVDAVTPLEKSIVGFRAVPAISGITISTCEACGRRIAELKQEIETLRIEQVRLSEDAEQAHRLQALLGFKEQFISKNCGCAGHRFQRQRTIPVYLH